MSTEHEHSRREERVRKWGNARSKVRGNAIQRRINSILSITREWLGPA